MKTTSLLYDSEASLRARIDSGELHSNVAYLVRIYTALADRAQASAIAYEVQALLPQAKIIGCSASGLIFRNQQLPDRDMILLDEFETTDVHIASVSFENRSATEVADQLALALGRDSVRLMHLLCGDHCPDSHAIVHAISDRFPGCKLVGGVAGDVLPKNEMGYVLTGEGVQEHCIVVAALCSETLHTYAQANVSHEPISPKYQLTESGGPFWKSVNGEPAESWVCDHLGIQKLQQYDDWHIIADNDVLVRFPMMLEGHHGASRFLQYDMENQCISQYFSSIPVGTEFRIGYVSPAECVKESFAICNDLMEQPVESLFTYSCLFRRMYLNNCSGWELSPYEGVGLCGIFMMGEISTLHGHNEFLNGACCMMALAENKVYIRPNIRVFEHLQQIQDDTKDLLNIVLKKQSENINRYNEELLDKLLDQQLTSQKQLYVDFVTGIGNYLQYREDMNKRGFNKICMLKIENSDLLISHLGHDAYTSYIRIATEQILTFIEKMGEQSLLPFYSFSENTFFMATDDRISEKHFLDISRHLFSQFQFIHVSDQDVLINRFVVVLNEENLIEIALNTFQANRNIQAPFLICEQTGDSLMSTNDELQMIGVLNRALEKDGVVPYFQGVYDNVTQSISKYEALMRIIDVDGTIYAPASFMGIAKKYHLYYHLSKTMMEKVFTLFDGRDESVSVNLSVYDINSSDMQQLIFELLANVKDGRNIIIEILEDEEFRDIDQLKNFITQVRKYGVKIAIDDFGAGYSNLLEIANIGPDFIKVDGGIVRDLHRSHMNQKIIDIIVFMGKHFNTDIIAEFVENKDIQRWVQEKNIRYSQGYYFSKPIPFDELNLDASNHPSPPVLSDSDENK